MKKLITISFLFLVSCKHGASFDDNVQEIEKKKSLVSAITTLDLTSETQYASVSDYFRTVADLALSLKTDPKAKTYLEKQAKAKKLSGFCSKYILTTTEWQSLNDQCIIDGNYLCPDEVREYPTIIHVIAENLPTSLKKDFDADTECAKWKSIK